MPASASDSTVKRSFSSSNVWKIGGLFFFKKISHTSIPTTNSSEINILLGLFIYIVDQGLDPIPSYQDGKQVILAVTRVWWPYEGWVPAFPNKPTHRNSWFICYNITRRRDSPQWIPTDRFPTGTVMVIIRIQNVRAATASTSARTSR